MGRPLQHVGNEGEHCICDGNRTYYVDGFDPVTRTIYEFNGCFWHVCQDCYPQACDERHQQLHGRTLEDMYRATVAQQAHLHALGYTTEITWEHQWTQLKTDFPLITNTVKSYDLKAPLNPRDAFFGGQTNAVRLYIDPRYGQQLCYYDFTSLYPWVNKYGRYPTKHPTFIYRPSNPRDL